MRRGAGAAAEPLLGPVDLHKAGGTFTDAEGDIGDPNPTLSRELERSDLGWVIVGGESGKNARPCSVDWIRSLIAQGKSAGIATFCKQLGGFPIINEAGSDVWHFGTECVDGCRDGRLIRLTNKKGGDPSEWPTDLRVREWPKGF